MDCLPLTSTTENLYRPSTKIINQNILKNIAQSKKNARYKAIHNFYQASQLSFLTLTLPRHNANGTFVSRCVKFNQN
ncbi:MAG: hypothetical protein Q8784_02295 [Vigna little leaf phytoplasma]|nr:hypothetical protein [Vigna little leaf phytoplasma]